MEKFIPYEKLSKKEKRKLDQANRQTWGSLSPTTRKPENSRAYNRNKARNWKREISRIPVPGFFFAYPLTLPTPAQTAPGILSHNGSWCSSSGVFFSVSGGVWGCQMVGGLWRRRQEVQSLLFGPKRLFTG